MLGCGFAFSLLPVLFRVHGCDTKALEEALGRHSDTFNAHPYLASVAVGAVARMESEGRDPETIERFKAAVRGPLGGLGDRLVWVGWLPLAALVGVATGLGDGSPWLSAGLFLIVYNVGHLGIRLWGFRTGILEGVDVGLALRSSDLARVVDRITDGAAALLGLVAGLVAVRGVSGSADGWIWIVAALVFGVVGHRLGPGVWRWASWILVCGAVLLSTIGGVL